MSLDKTRSELLDRALEACRCEIVERLTKAGLPLAIEVPRTIVVDNDGGWRTDSEMVSVSGLQDHAALFAIRDESAPLMAVGPRDQLLPLAEHLEQTTDLGIRPASFMPNETGSEAIIVRYLTQLAHRYLMMLDSLAVPSPVLVAKLQAELDRLCEQKETVRVHQLAMTGAKSETTLTHRGISLRPLAPHERGVSADLAMASLRIDLPRLDSEFIPPHRMDDFLPTALLSTRVTRPHGQIRDNPSMPNRVVLAFFLKGFDIGAAGTMVSFDQPLWASMGTSHIPFPVNEKQPGGEKPITQKEFEEVVDLAYKVPDFGGTEGSSREVALFRVFRGCGMNVRESGFLDFAIALEAALLGQAQTELAYRFRLYGSLFLRDERPPRETFDALKHVYKVRSALVHGGRVSAQERLKAEGSARDLAKAVTRRSIETDWPDAEKLDEVALTDGFSELGRSS